MSSTLACGRLAGSNAKRDSDLHDAALVDLDNLVASLHNDLRLPSDVRDVQARAKRCGI